MAVLAATPTVAVCGAVRPVPVHGPRYSTVTRNDWSVFKDDGSVHVIVTVVAMGIVLVICIADKEKQRNLRRGRG